MVIKIVCRYLCLLLIGTVLCMQPTLAQDNQTFITTISGDAAFAKGKEIRIIAIDDMVSYRQKVVAKDTIDINGNFRLTFYNPHTQLVQIAIQTSKAEFYAQTGRNYHFTIDMDPQLFKLLDPMAYGGYLQITNANPQHDINDKINRFEHRFNNLIDYFSPTLLSEINQDEIDSIHTYLTEKYPLEYEPDDFFKTYCYYSYGNFERIAYQKYADTLYDKYLNNEYLLYEHPAYMEFFNTFYDQFICTSPKIARKKLVKTINQEADYWALFNLVGDDPFLVNQRIREVVILKNLFQLYDNKEFNKQNIIKIIQQLAQTTHFDEHKKIAENILYLLEQTGEGHPLPAAHFKDITGIDFNIADLKGKWVFIQLFNTTCQDCIREMAVLQKLNEKYNDVLAIVSLSLDFNSGHLLQFKDHYPQFDWTFAHFNDEYEWIDKMQVSTLPDNMLITPEGNLYQRYAADISRDLAQFLARLFSKEEEIVLPFPQSRH